MYYRIITVWLWASTVLIAAWFGMPVQAFAEQITDFTAVYEIEADGTVLVTETITYDFGQAERRGIYRDIQRIAPQSSTEWYRERAVLLEIVSVSRDGVSEPYERIDIGQLTSIKIGNPDRELTGQQRYQITYTLNGAYAAGPEGAEFYWNVTGHDWPVPIKSAHVRLSAPQNSLLPLRACYRGQLGSTQYCDMQLQSDGDVIFSTELLAPGEGMTIAQAIDATAINTAPITSLSWWVLVVPVLGLLMLLWIWYVYHVAVANRPQRAIIVEYNPYENLPALHLGTLLDGQLNERDIVAGLLQLAQAGHLTITVIPNEGRTAETDYRMRLNTDRKTLPSYDSHLLALLFGAKPVGSEVLLSELRADQQQLQNNYRIWLGLKDVVRKTLIERGYFEEIKFTRKVFLIYILFVSIPTITGGVLAYLIFPYITVVVGLGIFILTTVRFVVFIVQRRTQQGYEALWHLRGFKQYLEVAEADRIKFHNAPQKSPEEFLFCLPYAIAFEVEQEWAAVFAHIQIPPVGWANGSNNPADLVKNMNNLIGSVSTLRSLPKSATHSRYSSGRTGSSGRGSSGGGGGGGGGRSW